MKMVVLRGLCFYLLIATVTGGSSTESITSTMMNAVTDMTSLLADVFEGTTSDPIPLGWHQTFIDNVQNDPSAVCLTLIGDFEFFFQYDGYEHVVQLDPTMPITNVNATGVGNCDYGDREGMEQLNVTLEQCYPLMEIGDNVFVPDPNGDRNWTASFEYRRDMDDIYYVRKVTLAYDFVSAEINSCGIPGLPEDMFRYNQWTVMDNQRLFETTVGHALQCEIEKIDYYLVDIYGNNDGELREFRQKNLLSQAFYNTTLDFDKMFVDIEICREDIPIDYTVPIVIGMICLVVIVFILGYYAYLKVNRPTTYDSQKTED